MPLRKELPAGCRSRQGFGRKLEIDAPRHYAADEREAPTRRTPRTRGGNGAWRKPRKESRPRFLAHEVQAFIDAVSAGAALKSPDPVYLLGKLTRQRITQPMNEKSRPAAPQELVEETGPQETPKRVQAPFPRAALGKTGAAVSAAARAAQRLRDDPKTRPAGRARDQDRLPHLPDVRDRNLSDQRRHPGERLR
jgi:hypothetical protein